MLYAKKQEAKKELKNYAVRELIEEMDTLTKITYSGRYESIISKVTKSKECEAAAKKASMRMIDVPISGGEPKAVDGTPFYHVRMCTG